jgi:hypothetical protein
VHVSYCRLLYAFLLVTACALLSRLTVDMGSYDAAVTFMVRQYMAC